MTHRFCYQLLILLVAASALVAQKKNPPAWLDYWRNVTVAFGQVRNATIKEDDGAITTKRIFHVIGTGALVSLPGGVSKIPWVVTAKHVFFDPEQNWDPAEVQVRFAYTEDLSVDKFFGITLKLKDGANHIWLAHPNGNVDLAAIPLTLLQDTIPGGKVSVIPYGNFATMDDIYEGAPVAVLGYPGAVGHNFWSKSILRQGIIAWIPPSDAHLKPLLIDCNVFRGNSGGPVFRLPTGTGRDGSFNVGGKVAFLGIISEGRTEELPVIGAGKKVVIDSPTGPIELKSPSFIGIGIVEPASRVAELLAEAARLLKN